MDSQDLTQPATQMITPNQNTSGLSEADVSDVLCILLPKSMAAHRVVEYTAKRNPQHILQYQTFARQREHNNFTQAVTELETIRIEDPDSPELRRAADIALRFSSHVVDPASGFCFGRNPVRCDIVLDGVSAQRRVSNIHFRIFVNSHGVLMLEDLSTNGTVVDGHTLGRRKRRENPTSRVLESGHLIEIMGDRPEEMIQFLLKIPSRDGHVAEYKAKWQQYLEHLQIAEQRTAAKDRGPPIPDAAARRMLAAPLAGPPNTRSLPTANPPGLNSNYGMHWSGGDEFTCVGVLGKGAFANVYQIATKRNGELYAAKELEKRRFVKNGVLDQRVDNEMKIMKDLHHPNIVQYINYVETDQHLYIIMEYLPYGDLSGYREAKGSLPEHLAKVMSQQMLEALAYLHDKNITHRDIKPDNILIASEDPFVTKLTDFGLSKVVKNNETFLKTFCGTLLYCAPEVFPHYDGYMSGRRPKRRRAQPNNRSYSQLVDVWSYAAVLWFLLCGKPPFEGVTDGNGRGMFQKIMETPLDISQLRQYGISAECIDLLIQMLNTNPHERPTERECLDHVWLGGKRGIHGSPTGLGLNVIAEDEELDASHLSIHDAGDPNGSKLSDSSDSGVMTNAKRQKGESFLDPHPQPAVVSSDGSSFQSIPIVNDVQSVIYQQDTPTKAPRLFGEIGPSALQGSGVYNEDEPSAGNDMAGVEKSNTMATHELAEGTEHDATNDQHLQTADNQIPSNHQITENQDGQPQLQNNSSAAETHYTGASAAASLLGAESMVRELKMASPTRTPEAGNSATNLANQVGSDPEPPKTPQNPPKGFAASPAGGSDESTPRPKFNRRIDDLDLPATAFFDPYDASTHNLEYATRVSGIDFISKSMLQPPPNGGMTSLPDTAINTLEATRPQSQPIASVQPPDHWVEQENRPISASTIFTNTSAANSTVSDNEFVKPAPILGKLICHPSSFLHLPTINLNKRFNTWGRQPSCTHVYRDPNDTRIPKIALDIQFVGKGIEGVVEKGDDWTKLDSLQAIVRTKARNGVWINGVQMLPSDSRGQALWGKLYSGDEIVVSKQSDGGELKFMCEFSSGISRQRRVQGNSFRVQEGKTTGSSHEDRRSNGGTPTPQLFPPQLFPK